MKCSLATVICFVLLVTGVAIDANAQATAAQAHVAAAKAAVSPELRTPSRIMFLVTCSMVFALSPAFQMYCAPGRTDRLRSRVRIGTRRLQRCSTTFTSLARGALVYTR